MRASGSGGRGSEIESRVPGLDERPVVNTDGPEFGPHGPCHRGVQSRKR
jgi:hypothetical protein